MKSTTPVSTIHSGNIERLLTGVALTVVLSLGLQGVGHPAAHGLEVPATSPLPQTAALKQVEAPAATTSNRQPLPDGTYLYGQSARVNQIGMAYLVFEVSKNKVVGAFYMPQSSFDCFHGNLNQDELALTIVNSYEKTSYPYEVALKTEATSASVGSSVVPTGLDGYQPISQLGGNEKRILSTCKANFGVRL
ncbi:hypothetical protein K9N68_32270 [Kovacikia minuta CCNUW1]|uniref:hypothetical protein n=1 Tax=Kovacikia minuta TaxID=2931930 RepID=UPI001CCDFF2A|nr:hypothetical protein [Kovacikia minuta]UBF26149.1 hypothetical protein K9N68_32270 [Kovacikia minuta CCNUW1]